MLPDPEQQLQRQLEEMRRTEQVELQRHREQHAAFFEYLRDELEEAEALLRDVVARKPGLYSPRYNLALLLRAQGELDEAVTELSRVVALNETFAKGWRSLGRALQARGDLLAAGDALLSALELEPDAPEALLDLAAAARAAGHTTAAADYYRAILRHDPEHEEANEGLYLVLTDIEEKRAKDHPS